MGWGRVPNTLLQANAVEMQVGASETGKEPGLYAPGVHLSQPDPD